MTATATPPAEPAKTPALEELVGVFSRVAYSKEDDRGWFIIAQLDGGQSIKGNANPEEFIPGISYRFYGKWGNAKAPYPAAFEFKQFVRQEPHNRKGVIQYLIKYASGIGPVYASQLWDRYGTDAVKILRTDLERVVRECPKIPAGKLKDSAAALHALAATEDVRIELTNLLDGRGFARNLADELIKKWGIHAVDRVKRDPFTLLVNRFPTCGFQRCDTLYRELGLPLDRIKRQLMCLWRHFQEDSNGHTWFSASEAEKAIRAGISGTTENVNWKRAVRLGVRAKWLSMHVDANKHPWITEAAKADSENTVAESLDALYHAKPTCDWPAPETLEGAKSHQKEVAGKSFSCGPIAILAGTPGTGKTTLAAIVIREMIKKIGSEFVAVCAPTGKASVRIQMSLESHKIYVNTGTIHRILCPERVGRDGNGWNFHYNETNKLPYDLIVVDEASMVDIETAGCLFKAIRPGTLVLIVGDPYQLPPVGHGATLRDLIESKLAGYGELTEVIRNDGDALRACRLIKDGGRPKPSSRIKLETGENWKHWEVKSPAQVTSVLENLIASVRGIELGGRTIDPLWDVQVVLGLNDLGPLNRKDISKKLQAILNPNGERVDDKGFRVGDKVICTENCTIPLFDDWQSDLIEYGSIDDDERNKWDCEPVANGEIGQVLAVDKRWFVVEFQQPYRVVLAPLVGKQAFAGKFQLGYAITFHKSQGSQWPIVLLLIDKAANRLASRELWYTGISRFESLVVTIGELAILHQQCRRVALKDRKTFLVEKLRAAMDEGAPF